MPMFDSSALTPLITTTPQTITQWATNPGQLENDRLSSGNQI
jgi:hypothetical protein